MSYLAGDCTYRRAIASREPEKMYYGVLQKPMLSASKLGHWPRTIQIVQRSSQKPEKPLCDAQKSQEVLPIKWI